ncbi:MAG: hypothetical protein IT518_04335 [Burkholderiales bacterium]|nr:hypothetical protein [Burkholderiales bacterium]
MNVHIIRADGREERVNIHFDAIGKAIGARGMDSVNLRDGRVMLVDDMGHIAAPYPPVNPKATEIYWSVCRPGTTHTIVGDVAIVVDEECA